MPRSNSSFGVAEGGNVVSAALAPRTRAAAATRRRDRAGWSHRDRAARPVRVRRERRRRLIGDRQLAAAERARRAGGVRVLVGVEGIAAAAAAAPAVLPAPARSARVLRSAAARNRAAPADSPAGPAADSLAAPEAAPRPRWAALHTVGWATGGWPAGAAARRRRAAAAAPRAGGCGIAVPRSGRSAAAAGFPAAGSASQVGIVGLCESLRRQSQHRGDRRGAGEH